MDDWLARGVNFNVTGNIRDATQPHKGIGVLGRGVLGEGVDAFHELQFCDRFQSK